MFLHISFEQYYDIVSAIWWSEFLYYGTTKYLEFHAFYISNSIVIMFPGPDLEWQPEDEPGYIGSSQLHLTFDFAFCVIWLFSAGQIEGFFLPFVDLKDYTQMSR